MKSTTPTSKNLSRYVEKLFTGAALTFALSLAVQGFINPAARSSEIPTTANSVAQPKSSSVSKAIRRQPFQDGTYLYGQSPNADQIGKAYMVFEVNKNRVIGAFYMPRSSFDCFHGSLRANQLALNVVNSYEQASYPYEVAVKTGSVSASAVDPATPTGLAGYYSLDRLSDNDQHILSTCKAQSMTH